MDTINQILAFIASASAGQIIAGVLMVIEFAMRSWPTTKAWSLLVPVDKVIVAAATILTWVSTNITKPLIGFANNVNPPAPAPVVLPTPIT